MTSSSGHPPRQGEPLDAARNPPFELRIERSLYREAIDHLAGAAPAEGVGLLAGENLGNAVRATRFFPGTNIDASPTRYTMDPVEVISAFREIDERGWELAAIVHSHPATAPIPSATDLRDARYPETLLLIVGLASTPPVARCWRVSRAAGNAADPARIVGEARLVVDGPVATD